MPKPYNELLALLTKHIGQNISKVLLKGIIVNNIKYQRII